LRNVQFLCSDIEGYYEEFYPRDYQAESVCKMLKEKFLIWLGGFLILLILRVKN